MIAGNYPAALRKVMNERGNWTEIESDDAIDQANFLYRPVNYGYMGYEQMNQRIRGNNPEILLFNHFEVNSGICTKSGLIRTLKKTSLY